VNTCVLYVISLVHQLPETWQLDAGRLLKQNTVSLSTSDILSMHR